MADIGHTMRNFAGAGACFCAALSLSACGFKPIYAAPAEGETTLVHSMAVAQVSAPEGVELFLTEALNSRMNVAEGEAPKYKLYVNAREAAQRLAVQIDASVTRYNYRLNAQYSVLNTETGDRINGSVRAVTSFNIVNSQYSTLFAEREAQEKASRELAALIERDLLLRFTAGPDPTSTEEDSDEDFLLEPESEFMPEIRREYEPAN